MAKLWTLSRPVWSSDCMFLAPSVFILVLVPCSYISSSEHTVIITNRNDGLNSSYVGL